MANNKAWIQYTKQGEIIPGSLILSPRRPVNGVWEEVYVDICCLTISTTTTSTTSTTTTTTICQRPQGVLTFSFGNTIQVGSGSPFVNFTASQVEACQALFDFVTLPDTTIGGFGVQAQSMSVGDTVYLFSTGTDCTVVQDGYYICLALSNTDVYHVVGGILTEILTCP